MKNLFNEDVPEYGPVESDFWCTPKELYPEGCFDPCPVNPTFDGLSIDWHGDVFCNPPYSQIEDWVLKARREATNPRVRTITMLLPNWTDRAWFQLIRGCRIEWFRGRLKFLDPKTGLPGDYNPRFGSMMVYVKE